MSWTDPEPVDDDQVAPPFDDFPEGHRAGFVTIIGRPNVGKSTLVNALIGERLAPTSPVPQTTRRRLLGILSRDDAQVVFVDTPGIHQPEQRLGHLMLLSAEKALVDADLVLCVFDATREPGEEDRLALQFAEKAGAPRMAVINKIDLTGEGGYRAAFRAVVGEMPRFETSAVTGDGLVGLLESVVQQLPEAPPFFPADQVTDVYEREIGGDLIREAALGCLQQELPHAVAVKIEEWKPRENGVLYLRAMVVVERESQKGIVIGRGGRMLKSIGTRAREKLEDWLQQKVYLDLQVKVMKKWRKDENALRWLGFTRD